MSSHMKPTNYKETYFPYATLTPVTGYPSYSDIQMLRKQAIANLASVPTARGGGQFGHMGLGVSPAGYARECPIPYLRATHPGPYVAPTSDNATALDHQLARESHSKAMSDFLEANLLERTILNQLQAALLPSILLPKTNRITGVITASIPDVFQFLFQAYGNITVFTLAEARQATIKHQYVHADPIENVFEAIQTYADMAEAHGTPESQQQLMDMALMIITSASIFADDVKAWNLFPTKTWPLFQSHFIQAQFTYKQARPSETASSLGYSTASPQANLVEDTTAAVLHENNAYIAELEAFKEQTLAQANQVVPTATPSPPPSTTDPILLHVLNEIKDIKASQSSSTPSTSNKKKNKKDKEKKDRRYCWTHGSCAHTGAECNHPADGHKKEATFANRMNGSTKGCWWLEASSTSA